MSVLHKVHERPIEEPRGMRIPGLLLPGTYRPLLAPQCAQDSLSCQDSKRCILRSKQTIRVRVDKDIAPASREIKKPVNHGGTFGRRWPRGIEKAHCCRGGAVRRVRWWYEAWSAPRKPLTSLISGSGCTKLPRSRSCPSRLRSNSDLSWRRSREGGVGDHSVRRRFRVQPQVN